ncbi:hypothetical protein N1030_07640 [Desulfovibrio mangrovi]|uniref:hypothetical protein n=1 Tax=Desulfovibrio mangrovi TaxID=2976983 RepID=UPI0022468587|nr:hypothetical protein [Desulfovibrio mangrovi]UZP68835.1 hypothetical protein N1030_07640 [Desulfovibrio mangrovi]
MKLHPCFPFQPIRIFLCLLVLLAITAFEAHAAYRVLQLNSYHPEFPTSTLVQSGAMSVFASVGMEMDVEYLDTKRHPEEELSELKARELDFKLQRRRKYSAVLTSDDNALRFALKHKDTLFRGLPIVFCGVNDVEFALSMNAEPRVTGVIEAVSMRPTMDLMFTLSPGVKRIVAITDATPSGQGDLRSFLLQKSVYGPEKMDVLDLSYFSWSELDLRLHHLQDDTAVLLLSAYGDVQGVRHDFETAMERIVSASPVPVYHLWRHGIGQGLVGGIVVSHFHQARAAALIVLDILHNDQSPGSIPVTDKSPNVCMMDVSLMTKWGLDVSRLPEGTELVNRPPGILERLFGNLTVAFAIVGGLLVLIFCMAVYIVSRRRRYYGRVELMNKLEDAYRGVQDSREYLKSILNVLPAGLVLLNCDGDIVDWNRRAKKWAAVPDMLEQGRNFFAAFSSLPISPSQLDVVMARMEMLHLSNCPVTLNGVTLYADIMVYPIHSSEGDRAVVRCEDVSGQVRMGEYMMGAEWLFSLGRVTAGLMTAVNNPLSAVLQDVQNVQRRLGGQLEENENAARMCGCSMDSITTYCGRRGVTAMLQGIRTASEQMATLVSELAIFVNEEQNEFANVNLPALLRKVAMLATTESELGVSEGGTGLLLLYTGEELPDVVFVREELELALLSLLKWHVKACVDAGRTENVQVGISAKQSADGFSISVYNPVMEYSEVLQVLPEAFTKRQMRLVPYMGAELTLVYLLVALRHNGSLDVEPHAEGGVTTALHFPVIA